MSHRLKNGGRRKTLARQPDGSMAVQDYVPPTRTNPGNLLHTLVGGGHLGDRIAHQNEAPYPEKLAEFFILSFCPPKGRVCDPFSGSGTTVVEAVRLGRTGIGFDIRESQIYLARQRLALRREQGRAA
jgi:hypothetical protein